MSAPTYLADALISLKESLADTLEEVQKVELGQPTDALADVSARKSRLFIHLTDGFTVRRGIGDCDQLHAYGNIRCYWTMSRQNRELVEKSVANMIVQIPYYYSTTSGLTLAEGVAKWYLRSTAGVSRTYQVGYEIIGGKQHRVLIFSIEVEITL